MLISHKIYVISYRFLDIINKIRFHKKYLLYSKQIDVTNKIDTLNKMLDIRAIFGYHKINSYL